MLGREDEFEAASRLISEPGPGFLGDVCGMIVEDQLDRRMGRIGGIDELKEFDEFAAAMAVLDQGVNLAGEQIDTGQQTDCAIALVLVIAREGRMFAGLRRQVRSGRSERLNARLLVVGDDRHRIARLLFRSGRGGLNEPYLAVDAQNLRHLLFELRVASFQVIAHFVRLYFLPIEYVAQRALSQFGKAAVPPAGPCSRAWRARSRVVHNSCGYPSSLALRQARFTTQALASAVIVGSLPGRGRSSSATIGP